MTVSVNVLYEMLSEFNCMKKAIVDVYFPHQRFGSGTNCQKMLENQRH